MSNQPAVQMGFIYDPDKCVFCRTCEAACKGTRNVEIGVFWRKVSEAWHGEYPDVSRSFLSAACHHCAEPACLKACPTGAITKRPEDGVVLVDRELCNGCRECLTACPYDIPQFGADGIMQKCDMCIESGTEPACAAHCPTGALSFGDINQPVERPTKTAEHFPGPTGPSFIILKPVEPRR